MSCCVRHKEKVKDSKDKLEKESKSFIGKWLYKVGKAGFEKDKEMRSQCH